MLSVKLPTPQNLKQVEAHTEQATTTATTTEQSQEETASTEDEPAPSDEEPPDLRAYAIAIKEAIRKLESKGSHDCENTPGLSGEKGCFQYLPSTWASYSRQVYGYEVEQTATNADYVTEEIIYSFLEQGYSARGIFLIWNQGHAGQCKSGYNSHGVYYDSCGYADRGLLVLNQIINERS